MDDAIAAQERAAPATPTASSRSTASSTPFVTAAGNPIVPSLYDSLRDRQQRMIITSLLREPSAARRSSSSTGR